mgnify:CR=1 FL=1
MDQTLDHASPENTLGQVTVFEHFTAFFALYQFLHILKGRARLREASVPPVIAPSTPGSTAQVTDTITALIEPASRVRPVIQAKVALPTMVSTISVSTAAASQSPTVLPPGYLCCGYPQRGSGQFDKAEKMITDNRVLFHRVANTLNYLDIKTVVVSCGTCYDQLQGYEFDKIFPGCRIIDIHEYLLEKGITLPAGQGGYLYHEPCHNPMKQGDSMKTVRALVGDKVLKSDRCCGESGTLGVTRPDISTQVRFRKEEEIRKGEAQLRASGAVGAQDNIKILTSCPSCLQGITRYGNDLQNGLLEADYIVIEMAKQLLGENWLPEYVQRANQGGIERVLV